MCFDADSAPPIPVIAGAAVSHDALVLEASDGNRFAAFLATPEEPAETGVVILPDVRGLYRFYEELALRFAERGYAALAFDYFGRTAGAEKRDQAGRVRGRLGRRLAAHARLHRPARVIREARPDEAATLAAIQRDASLAALAHIFPPAEYPYPIDEVTERWEEALADEEVEVFVAEEECAAVGVAGARAEWLDGLYVLPEWWSRGVGRALHDHVLERLRAAGSEQCHLWVLEHNDRARRFYERLGWHEDGTSRVVPFPPNPIDLGYSIAL